MEQRGTVLSVWGFLFVTTEKRQTIVFRLPGVAAHSKVCEEGEV